MSAPGAVAELRQACAALTLAALHRATELERAAPHADDRGCSILLQDAAGWRALADAGARAIAALDQERAP